MKKVLLIVMTAFAVISCSQEKKGETSNSLPKATPNAQNPAGTGSVAYVEIDSLANQYKFCVEQLEMLKQKQSGYEAQLKKEQNALSSLASTIQQNLQEGKYKSEAEYKNALAAGQKQETQYAKHQEQYSQAMVEATAEYQKELRKRLNDFLKEYNKDGRFSLILTNSEQAINVLYAAPSLDITEEVVEGLNKAYEKTKSK